MTGKDLPHSGVCTRRPLQLTIGGFRMNGSRTCEWALSEVIEVDLSPEELQRLTRVDALLRAVAACDRARDVEDEAR